MKVFKFGGACIQHPEAVSKLAQLIKAEQPHPLVIVVSAMGKTTRGLEEVLQQKHNARLYEAAIQPIYRFHQEMIDALLYKLRQEAYQALTLWKKQLITSLTTPVAGTSLDKLYSNIVAGGELIASTLIYYYLQERNMACAWVDARSCIKTNSGFCNAQIDWGATQHGVAKNINPILKEKKVVLTQGFIGGNEVGETTTLGKEGSDFTGAILAVALGAQSLTIWKDVPGIMNADPKLFKKAIKFDRISYKTMAEMAFYGAKVLHPKTVQPLATHNIPLYIKPFHRLHEQGTVIANESDTLEHPIYILQKDQGLIQLDMDDLTFFDEKRFKEVLHQLTKHNTPTNMLEKGAYTLSICLNADTCKMDVLLTALNQKFTVRYHTPVNLLTVIHQDESSRLAWPRPQAILWAQRKGHIYQAVLQHGHAIHER